MVQRRNSSNTFLNDVAFRIPAFALRPCLDLSAHVQILNMPHHANPALHQRSYRSTIGIRMEFCLFAARHDADREYEEESP